MPHEDLITKENVIVLAFLLTVMVITIVMVIAAVYTGSYDRLLGGLFGLFEGLYHLLDHLTELLIDAAKTVVMGSFSTIFEASQKAFNAIYRDVSVDKVVVFMGVATMVRQFPWMMEMAVKLLAKPPSSN
jgi:hypothetical protein